MPVFNPVVRNGLFEVSGFGVVKAFRAVDAAEAKFKFARFVAREFEDVAREAKVRVVEPTRRAKD